MDEIMAARQEYEQVRELARVEVERARAAYVETVRRAHEAGAGYGTIAKWLGCSRNNVVIMVKAG